MQDNSIFRVKSSWTKVIHEHKQCGNVFAVDRDRVHEGGEEGEVGTDVQAAGAEGVAGRQDRHVRHAV